MAMHIRYAQLLIGPSLMTAVNWRPVNSRDSTVTRTANASNHKIDLNPNINQNDLPHKL